MHDVVNKIENVHDPMAWHGNETGQRKDNRLVPR